ncbi:TPA: hypothetical protein HLY57_09420 [Escherichia coli]|jgi:hypothetical protein|nr:hypothetical protein [Escherichia coli]HAN3397014.1 hypothetical protein [Escherichia coli]HBH7156296.1 hypothetical protein [Escherichia coli]HBH7222297.1 hypothetical protein [Escherichia coli]HBH7711526.1 hypothetical protein [Escherichia coli]
MQVKCSYSSNDGVFTTGRIYDVHIVYGNENHTMNNCLALIDNQDEIWIFRPSYSGGEISGVGFAASFERY